MMYRLPRLTRLWTHLERQSTGGCATTSKTTAFHSSRFIYPHPPRTAIPHHHQAAAPRAAWGSAGRESRSWRATSASSARRSRRSRRSSCSCTATAPSTASAARRWCVLRVCWGVWLTGWGGGPMHPYTRAYAKLQREKRTQGYPVVALVGYTNSGKSTLLNALTQAGALAEDLMFATLDPTTRYWLIFYFYMCVGVWGRASPDQSADPPTSQPTTRQPQQAGAAAVPGLLPRDPADRHGGLHPEAPHPAHRRLPRHARGRFGFSVMCGCDGGSGRECPYFLIPTRTRAHKLTVALNHFVITITGDLHGGRAGAPGGRLQPHVA